VLENNDKPCSQCFIWNGYPQKFRTPKNSRLRQKALETHATGLIRNFWYMRHKCVCPTQICDNILSFLRLNSLQKTNLSHQNIIYLIIFLRYFFTVYWCISISVICKCIFSGDRKVCRNHENGSVGVGGSTYQSQDSEPSINSEKLQYGVRPTCLNWNNP
jgi:hypothetical protein